jgi:hypothetical protein
MPMIRAFGVMLLAAGLVSSAWLAETRAQDKKEEKGKEIEIDGMKAAVPGSWKQEKPENRLRYLQFRLPKVKDDKEDAVLIVTKIGGSAEENIKRWKAQMIPPEGKSLDDVVKVTDFKIGDVKAPYMDGSGTYKDNPQPFNPQSKTVNRPNYRLLAIHYEGKDDPYQFKLYGPADTVANYKQGFEDWLKALKK